MNYKEEIKVIIVVTLSIVFATAGILTTIKYTRFNADDRVKIQEANLNTRVLCNQLGGRIAYSESNILDCVL